jgi:hypothetical protein
MALICGQKIKNICGKKSKFPQITSEKKFSQNVKLQISCYLWPKKLAEIFEKKLHIYKG